MRWKAKIPKAAGMRMVQNPQQLAPACAWCRSHSSCHQHTHGAEPTSYGTSIPMVQNPQQLSPACTWCRTHIRWHQHTHGAEPTSDGTSMHMVQNPHQMAPLPHGAEPTSDGTTATSVHMVQNPHQLAPTCTCCRTHSSWHQHAHCAGPTADGTSMHIDISWCGNTVRRGRFSVWL